MDDATLNKAIELAQASLKRQQGGWTPRIINNSPREAYFERR
jgi:hypothetical protein